MRLLPSLTALASAILVYAAAGAAGGTAPAFAAAPAFDIAADVVTSGENKGLQGTACVNQSVFFPGDVVVFRAVIRDGATGEPLTAEQVKARGIQAVVTIPGGVKIPLRLGLHPPPQAKAPTRLAYWTGAYPISRSHPTGTLPWTLTVADAQGHDAIYTPIGQGAGLSVLTIAQKAPAAAQ